MLALDRQYKMLKGKTNILFYKYNPESYDFSDMKVIHPRTAIILALFNGSNSIEEINSALMYLFDLQKAEVIDFIKDFIRVWQPFLIEVDRKIRDDNPFNYIIPERLIEMGKLRLTAPMQITLNITQKCGGRRCIYCYAQGEEFGFLGEMPFSKVLNIIKQAKDEGVEIITLSGGDAFVHKDIIDIIKIIIRSGIHLQLSTKRFLKNKTIALLKDIGVTQIQISIDALDNRISERLTGCPMYAKNALDTIAGLIAQGIIVSTNSVVTGLNAFDIPALILRLSDIGVNTIRLSQYFRSAYRHSDELFMTETQVMDIKTFVDNFNLTSKVKFSNSLRKDDINSIGKDQSELNSYLSRPMCSAGRLAMLIVPNGKVLPCEQLPCIDKFILGDVKEQSIKEIWNSDKFNDLFNPDRDLFSNALCYDCQHFDLCIIEKGWCMRDAWKSYGTIYQISPICPKAKAVPGRRLS